MLPQDIIARKRDRGELARAEIQAFVTGLVGSGDAAWSEGQAAALAMAIVLNGMRREETVVLTHAMTHSGRVLDWRTHGFSGPVLDKHSTGGVGDKVSLMLAPIVAAAGADAGVIVPMVSGRGLGHTGGTLDKLEALPGYDAYPSEATLLATLRATGCAIVGASETLAPADRRLYAIRDVTATVDSVPLITASILSKKLAAGLTALVLDVKMGSGAVMKTLADARALAQSLVEVAAGAGLPARALVTDMDRVLGRHAGNALEVREAIDFLTGAPGSAREPRLEALTLRLAAELLQLGGVAPTLAEAHQAAERALASGAAAERFAAMVAALGGPHDVLADAQLAAAPVVRDVPAPRTGVVQRLDVRAIGQAVVALGGGRQRTGERIDPRVGLADVVAPGTSLAAGAPLARVHAATAAQAEEARRAVQAAVTIGDAVPAETTLVHEVLAGG